MFRYTLNIGGTKMELYTKNETQGQKTKICRINKDGFYEEIYYTGNLKNKPKGWTIKRIT